MLGLALVGLVVGTLRPAPANAATITVTTLQDEGGAGPDCSLREAVEAASTDTSVGGCSAGSGNDTITFSVTGTITLNYRMYEQMNVTTGTLTIRGPGSDHLTIDGSGLTDLFLVNAPAQLTLSGLTLANGLGYNLGGAIYNAGGDIVITDCVFTGNQSRRSIGGGAIFSRDGSLSITNSTFNNNQSTLVSLVNTNGGAIYSDGSSLSIKDSTFTNNTARDNGGAIYHYGGPFSISGSTFRNNESTNFNGGAIYLNQAQLDLSTSTFDHNTADDRAGAIYIYDGILNLTTSTLSNNVSGGYGGALYNDDGTITITNSTIVGNEADDHYGGSAIYHDGSALSITNSTFAANQSGDLAALLIDSGSAGLKNVLLANATPGDSPNCGGSITDQGGNIAADASCDLNHPTSQNNADPRLGQLSNNGGPTLTLPLLDGSPAIDAGVGCPPPTTDQRGATRTAPCSSGAFEADAPLPVSRFGVTVSTTTATAGVPLELTVTALDDTGERVAGYRGTVQFSSTDPAFAPGIDFRYTFTAADAGAHTFPVTFQTAGPAQTITVTDTVTSTRTGTNPAVAVQPVISRISPAYGPATGTAVTIEGRGFSTAPGGTRFVFADEMRDAFTDVVCTTDTVCEATAIAQQDNLPEGSAEAIPIQALVAGQRSPADSQDRSIYFAWYARPLLTSLSSSSGPPMGGNQVTLSGGSFPFPSVGFQAPVRVSFGSAAVDLPDGCQSNGTCTVTAPAGSGTVDVTITTPGGTSAVLSYTYQPGSTPTPPPGPAMTVQGTVTRDGRPVFAGAIEARVGGMICGAGAVLNGAFQLRVASSATLPGCGTEGAAVSFRVNGVAAEGSVTFSGGGSVSVTLRVSGAAGAPALPQPSIPPLPGLPIGPFWPLTPSR
ncbi:MAG: choice-of-anchor Q domain-containing protein [Dehalococcoidia bacterium]